MAELLTLAWIFGVSVVRLLRIDHLDGTADAGSLRIPTEVHRNGIRTAAARPFGLDHAG